MTIQEDYTPTPSLPDDKGKALLGKLDGLYVATDFDFETSKKVRSGSRAERWATAALEAALIKAAADFEHHRDFKAWLCENNREHIEAYDPVSTRGELTDQIRDLKWRIERLEEGHSNTLTWFLKFSLCMSPEQRRKFEGLTPAAPAAASEALP